MEDILIGFVLGMSTASLASHLAVRRYVRNKLALRKLISEMYHKDLLPELCRAIGLVDLATKENHHLYAGLALKELKVLKDRITEIIKKYEPFQ